VKARLFGSLVLGAIAAAIVVVYDDTANHAALVRAAARSHQTVASSLAAGFAGVTLFVAVIVFVVGAVLAGRRKAPVAAARREWQGAPRPQPRRRGRAGAWR